MRVLAKRLENVVSRHHAYTNKVKAANSLTLPTAVYDIVARHRVYAGLKLLLDFSRIYNKTCNAIVQANTGPVSSNYASAS